PRNLPTRNTLLRDGRRSLRVLMGPNASADDDQAISASPRNAGIAQSSGNNMRANHHVANACRKWWKWVGYSLPSVAVTQAMILLSSMKMEGDTDTTSESRACY